MEMIKDICKYAVALGTCLLLSPAWGDYSVVFDQETNPLQVLTPAHYTKPILTSKVSWQKGVLKVNDAHAVLHAPGIFRYGYAELSGTDQYRSQIELLARIRQDFGAYYSLSVNTHGRNVTLKRYRYGQPDDVRNFTYAGGKVFRLRLEFDGREVQALVNGERLGSLPDDGSIREGYVGVRCGYWTNVALSALSWQEQAPKFKEASMPPYLVDKSVPKIDIAGLKNWTLGESALRRHGRRVEVSLNQLWDFQPVVGEAASCREEGAAWGSFMVPGYWAKGARQNFMRNRLGEAVSQWQGVEYRSGGVTAWFRRTFQAPPAWEGQRVEFRLEDVTGQARVLVNGVCVAEKNDPVCGFVRADISQALKAGQDNEIRLQVWSQKNKTGGVGCASLVVMPHHNFGDVAIDTDVRQRRLALAFRRQTVPAGATLAVKISEGSGGAVLFAEERPFAARLAYSWLAPRLWTPDDPALYRLTMTLKGTDGTVLDEETLTFGYRQFEARDGGFWLNGQPITLKADTAVRPKGQWWNLEYMQDVEQMRPWFAQLKQLNLNCCYLYGPPTERVMQLADSMGIMLIVWGRMLTHYELDRETEKALAKLERALKVMQDNPVYGRHPSQIGFLVDVWYAYNAGCTNPNYVGRPQDDPNLQQAILAQRSARLQRMSALYKRYFPALETFTGGSGPVGNIYGTHIYHTWGAPATELRGLFSKWAETRAVPIFVGETYLPYIGAFFDVQNFRGGADNYVTENAVRLLGPAGYAYRSTLIKRPFHERYEKSWFWNTNEKKDGGRYGFQPDAPLQVITKYLEEIYTGWRYHGLTGYGNFDHATSCFAAQWLTPKAFPQTTDLAEVSYKPEGFDNGNARRPSYDVRYADGDLRPTLLAAPFRRAMADLSAAILHGGDDPLLQDHSAFAGERVARKIAVFNDTQTPQTFRVQARLANSQGRALELVKEETLVVPARQKLLHPLTFTAPDTADRGDWTLQVTLTDAQTLRLSQELQVFARPASPRLASQLYLYDPEGLIVAFLEAVKVPFVRLTSLSPLPQSGVLVLGRNAMIGQQAAANWQNLGGLRVLFMEQALEASVELMKSRTRQVFINAPSHPVFAGLRDVDFSYWQGSSANAPDFVKDGAGANWSAWGSRNMVAAHVFRRPHHGNFLSLLVSGFDLFQTPLLEYRSTQGSWIASQLELTERLGRDPVATRLFYNLLRYLDVPASAAKVLFFGGKQGQALVEKLGAGCQKVERLDEATLSGAEMLIVSEPTWEVLRQSRLTLTEFVYHGGTVLYMHAGGEFVPSWLPFTTSLATEKAEQASLSGSADGVWLNGFGPSELYWKTARDVPAFQKLPPHIPQARPAVLAQYPFGRGRWLLTTLRPELFGDDTPATGKTVKLLSALMTSLGITIEQATFPFNGDERVPRLDLSELKWEFATDEKNVGLQEAWHLGKGQPRWLKGLIADGLEVRVGQTFETFLRYDYNGYAWYRLTFEAPEDLCQAETLYFSVGAIDDFDEVYLNGVKIGATGEETPRYWEANRNYRLPRGLLRPQGNFLAVRVFDKQGDGGIVKGPVQLSVKKLDPNPRIWTSPWPKAMKRDYQYPCDIVRMY